MKQFDYTIKDPLGIHARPAGMFAKLCKGFGDTVVTISKDGLRVEVGVVHAQPAEHAFAHVHVVRFRRDDAAHVGIVVAVLPLGREPVSRLRTDRAQGMHRGRFSVLCTENRPLCFEPPLSLFLSITQEVSP